jgi:hypothetical protein
VARAKSLADKKNRHWKYILLLQNGHSIFADTFWELMVKIFRAWKRWGNKWAS